MAKQPLKVEMFYGGAWQDVTETEDVYTRNPIEVTRGRRDEAGQSAPAAAGLTLDNRGGVYNPRNPASPLYGLAGRNTPVRIRVGGPHVGAAGSDTAASTSHAAPSVDSPTPDGLLFCAWSAPDPAGTYTVPGSMTALPGQADARQSMRAAREIITAAGATGIRTATFSTSESWQAVTVLIDGPTAITTGVALSSTGAITVDGGVDDWWVMIGSYAWDDPDADLSAMPTDTDGNGWVLLADTGTVNHADSDAAFGRMRAWAKQVNTTNGAHDIEVDFADTLLLGLGRIPAAEVGTVYRIHGEAASWQLGRAVKGDAWTSLTIADPLRRLGQGTPPVRSALTRCLTGADEVAGYWPLEGLPTEGTIVIPAAVGPGARIRSTGSSIIAPVQWSAEANLPGSGPLPTLTAERGVAGVETSIAVEPDPALGVMYWTRTAVPAKSDSNNIFTQATLTLFLTDAAGTVPRYHLTVITLPPGTTLGTEETLTVRAGTATGTGASIDSVETTTAPFVDGWRHVYARFSQSGGSIAVSVRLDGDEVASGSFTGTLDAVRAMRMGWFTDGGSTDQVDPISGGHPAILAGTTAALDAIAASVYAAGLGHPGEYAGDRFERLCAEEGIASTVVGTAADTIPMGPQYPDTIANLLLDVEATDDGLLNGSRDQLGLTYRTGRSRYNQTAKLALDYDAFEVAPPTDPVIDDLAVRNDVTASRREGSSARAVRESGPLNVSEPADDPEGVGRYTHQATVNPMSDDMLADQAGWHLHLGTVDETRWPQITVDLDATPALAAVASTVVEGDRITVDNVPDDLSPDQVSLIVLGQAETVGSHRRTITFTCAPESPFHIAELDHALYSLAGSDGSTVAADFDAGTDTSLSVTVAAGYPLWDDEAAPFDISAEGVRLTVTAITGSSSPQTFTITQAPVNGVEKTIPAGARVDLYHRSFIGL